jgi:hypothetical protein
VVDDGFDAFWQEYPRKDGKTVARTRWGNLSARKRQQAMAALPVHVARWQSRGGDWRQFVPHASTWLNQERYADEVTPPERLPEVRNGRPVNGRTAERNPFLALIENGVVR